MDTSTALTLVFPQDTHQKINQIRSIHDQAYNRWFPHINFLFPFVPVDQFDEIVNRLAHLNNFDSFELNMNSIGYFNHKLVTNFHLKAENDSNLQKLFKIIREALPEIKCKHDVFHPHLTLGQFPKNEIDQRKRELESWLGSGIKITVDRIQLINRDKTNGTPFEINREILLRQNNASVNSYDITDCHVSIIARKTPERFF